MDAKITCIAGPLKGVTTALTDADLNIGRERSNDLAIADPDLSRRHCVIQKSGSEYKIVDLASRNGIFVNSVPTREWVLQHGDHVEAGSSIFIFLSRNEEVPVEPSFIEGPFTTGSLMTTRWHQDQDTPGRVNQVEILLKISDAITRIRDLTELGNTLMQLLFQVIPADRGAVLVLDASQELKPIASANRVDPSDTVQVLRNAVQEAMNGKNAVLATQVQHGAATVPSLICAPQLLFDDAIGCLYLETAPGGKSFTDQDLELAAAIANLSAPAIRNCLEIQHWMERSRQLQSELRMNREIVGESAAMRAVFDLIRKVSGADTTVLILGESGTGKELAAQAIHSNSRRSGNPFVAINCAALPDSLLESELFGYEKGAFTGASAQKKGKLELADGGTLFLDEIAELAPQLQAKLLRFLQEREFERIGGNRSIRVNLRVVAATNRTLEKEVTDGKFRQDLYYRLNVVKIEMPPLRSLREDILLLANYFVSRFQAKLGRKVRGISPEAQRYLLEYEWPGNVRELENVLERAVLLGATDVIVPEDFPEPILSSYQPSGESGRFHEDVAEYKRKILRKALQAANNNYNEAAAKLGIHPTHLYRLVRTLKLDHEQ